MSHLDGQRFRCGNKNFHTNNQVLAKSGYKMTTQRKTFIQPHELFPYQLKPKIYERFWRIIIFVLTTRWLCLEICSVENIERNLALSDI